MDTLTSAAPVTPIRTGHTELRGSRTAVRAPKRPRGERTQRRFFSNDYKLSVLAEYDRCSEPGDKGALLRREGLYSSLLTEWRRARDSGALGALEPKQRGPKPPSAERVENAALRRQLERSQADLETARRVIEVQGNVSALLEELLAKSAHELTSEPRPSS